MVWAVQFRQDTDRPGVGTVTATDPESGVSFSREQVDTNNAAKVAAMVTKAKQAAAAALAKKQAEDAVAAAIAAELNK